MNLPNQLTLLRLILVPFFLVYTISDSFWTRLASLFLFILAAVTDLLDGRLARQRNEVTRGPDAPADARRKAGGRGGCRRTSSTLIGGGS